MVASGIVFCMESFVDDRPRTQSTHGAQENETETAEWTLIIWKVHFWVQKAYTPFRLKNALFPKKNRLLFCKEILQNFQNIDWLILILYINPYTTANIYSGRFQYVFKHHCILNSENICSMYSRNSEAFVSEYLENCTFWKYFLCDSVAWIYLFFDITTSRIQRVYFIGCSSNETCLHGYQYHGTFSYGLQWILKRSLRIFEKYTNDLFLRVNPLETGILMTNFVHSFVSNEETFLQDFLVILKRMLQNY